MCQDLLIKASLPTLLEHNVKSHSTSWADKIVVEVTSYLGKKRFAFLKRYKEHLENRDASDLNYIYRSPTVSEGLAVH